MDSRKTLQIGVSRPPLPLDDLPTPEEVFGVSSFGFINMIKYVLGPSMIALGVSLGSGEWLLGPLGFGRFGFVGLGFLVTISAILQTFYNVENGRYTLATGEVPVVGFTRTPPGEKFWVPLTLFMIYLAYVWGGWAAAAGQSLFPIFAGRLPVMDLSRAANDVQSVRFIAMGLLVLSLGVYLIGKKISRTLELVESVAVFFILAILITLTIMFAPAKLWGTAFASIVTPAGPPKGIDATTLGSIIGYTGFASGMNFMLINYYRDHGYGMGFKIGFFSGLIGGQKQEVLPSGVTFPESAANTKTWNRWFRFLAIDQWAVFFVGAMIGMFIPSILAVALAVTPGAEQPTAANMPVYVATELGKQIPWIYPFILILGALILWKTQTTLLEMLVRNTADAAIAVSPRLRSWIGNDPRKFYYPMALLLIIVISIIIHLALPTKLLQYAANLANLASIIFPLVLIYLNSKLPRPARAAWWSYVMLLLNVVFFGFFFLNFLIVQVTGSPLVAF